MKRRTFPRLLAAAAAVLILLGIGAYAASPFFSYQESVATLSKVGSQGDEVRKIQTRLKELGYDPGSVDGIFGEKTRKAVVAFHHVMNGGNGIVQQRKAAAHIFNVSDIFGRCFVRDRSAVETEQDGRVVMLRAAGEQRADQRQRQNQR